MPKKIQVSSDNITWYTLPGNSGEVRNEAGELVDTIFGQSYQSSEAGLITGSINANAYYKGFAGYIVTLAKGGTPVAMTAEPMVLVSGKTYIITATTKQFIDVNTVTNVFVTAVNQNANVESINFVTGEVTFISSYTPGGAVTITGAYIPTTAIAKSRTFTLTQTTDVIDNTDIPTAKSNGGYRTYQPDGLKTVNLEIGGVYAVANGFLAALQGRIPTYILINPDNTSASVAKGLFKFSAQGQSGDVGALEEETLSLRLNVPADPATAIPWKTPFAWKHTGATTLSMAVQKTLDAWQNSTMIYVKYLWDGTTGFSGQATVTDVSLAGGLESMNTFTANFQLSGAMTVIP